MKPSLTRETTWGFVLRAFCLGLVLLGFLPSLRAQQFGLFTYRQVEDTVEITGYPRDAVGAVEIPAVIDGLPVTRIDFYAFSSCSGLTSVTIPSTLTSIAGAPFEGCTGLTAINVEAGNPAYASDEGVLLNAARTTLLICPAGKTGAYTIPSSVTSIGYGAFYGCTRLTHVTISEGITRIPEGAFSGCSALTSVIIPEGVTDIGTQDWDTVGAFSDCTGLTNISLPSSLTNIGVGTFFGCTGLTAINVEAGNPTYASESGVLLDATRARLIMCPLGRVGHYSIPSSVTTIEGFAFSDCAGLTSITIPSSVTNIGEYAFYSCTGLTSATLQEGLTTIGRSMFAGCTGLTSITIPSSVTHISDWAFSGCTGLTHVTIPSSVTNLGYSRIFHGWGWDSLPQPGGVFAGCTGLTSIILSSNLTSIVEATFAGCTGLTSITIPSSVTTIGKYAFFRCTGLTSVSLPEGLTTIEGFAFSGCTGLTSVTLPSSVTSIGPFYTGHAMVYAPAFGGCTALGSFVVKPGNTVYSSVEGVLFNAAQTGLVSFPEGKAGNYVIPSSVTSIGDSAFSYCKGLTSVTLPNSVTYIGRYAFSGCTGLANFTIPATVTLIYDHAFSGCTGLTRLLFLGDAPHIVTYGMAWSDFAGAAPGFTIYYLSSRRGFTSPTWNDYPATMINEATYPAASWLLKHGLWYDSALRQDPDGDGVNLLTAYALNLDPRLNLQGRLPGPLLGADTLSLNFHASSPGITYRVETSTNLTHWTTTGVTQTAPGADGRSTASVLRDAPQRFLRLSVQD